MRSLVVALVLLQSCTKPDSQAASVTYHKDIKPLLAAKCGGCHAIGQVAFPLAEYADVVQHRFPVEHAVTARTMPVWLAQSGHEAYQGDPSLTPAEMTLFTNWFAAGLPEGNPDTAPSQPPRILLSDLSGNLTITQQIPGEGYLPNQASGDDYRCFVLPWPEFDNPKLRQFVTGFQALPGNQKLVHHLVSYVAKPQMAPLLKKWAADEKGAYQCFGGALPDKLNDRDMQQRLEAEHPGLLARINHEVYWLAHWAPGMRGQEFPAGTGIPVFQGSVLVLQVHYYTVGNRGTRDNGSSLRFRIANDVAKPAFVLPLSKSEWFDGLHNNSLVIPPQGEATVTTQKPLADLVEESASALELGPIAAVEVHAANLHMHSFGKSAITSLVTRDGKEDVLLEIPKWDLRWQRDYFFDTPKTFSMIDAANVDYKLSCTYRNQLKTTVYGGFSSSDEMCMNFSYIALIQK